MVIFYSVKRTRRLCTLPSRAHAHFSTKKLSVISFSTIGDFVRITRQKCLVVCSCQRVSRRSLRASRSSSVSSSAYMSCVRMRLSRMEASRPGEKLKSTSSISSVTSARIVASSTSGLPYRSAPTSALRTAPGVISAGLQKLSRLVSRYCRYDNTLPPRSTTSRYRSPCSVTSSSTSGKRDKTICALWPDFPEGTLASRGLGGGGLHCTALRAAASSTSIRATSQELSSSRSAATEAIMLGVSASVDAIRGSAPCNSSNRTVSVWPWNAALQSGVRL
mmetsp:Transcript_12491/g.29230  ORF Transcript_12491/g.29230 Transcript_12491/m.29230 type:complete len:277 (-) Transcript_12491:173-1003(-)